MASFAYDDEEDLALRGLRLEPEERHHDTCDAIWHWLQSQPGHVARYFRWRTAPQAAIHEFCRTIKLVSVRKSTLLCRQGEVGTSFYIVLHGSCEVLHHPVRMVSAVHARIGVVGNVGAIVVSSADRSRLGCRVGVMTAGMVFGEMSACGNERDSSVVALGSHSDEDGGTHLTELLQIDFRAYSRCTPSTLVKAEAILRRRVEQLMHLTLFADWPTQELGFFARWITEITLKERDEIVYAEGEPVDCVYFVLKGSVGLQCQHPTDRDGLLNLHHLPAPRFFGEDELMQGIEERVHTAVTVEPNTVLGMLPARVFRVLLTSQYPASSYKSAATLAAIRRSRTDWYDIRMSLGDSAAVPFSFLDHSQNKVLIPEVYQGIITRERHIDNLFTPVLSGEDGALSTARKQALGLSTPGSSKGEGGSIKKRQRPRSAIRRKVSLASPMFGDHEGAGHAEAAAAINQSVAQGRSSPMPLTSRSVVPPLNLGGGSPAKAPTPVRAGEKPATPTAFEKFYSGTYHRPSTPEAPPTPPPEPALDPADLLGTPRFELERPSSPMDWNAQPVTEDDFERQKTRGTIAVELGSVMKAVSQFKKLLHRRRARQARQRAAAAAASEHGPSSHRSRGSDEGLGMLSGSLTPHVHGHMPHAMGGAGREAKRHRRPEGMRPLGELARPTTSHTRGKSLARTGSMGAATLAHGPVRGASLRGKSLRGTKSLGAMVSSPKSSSRLLPSIRHPPAQQGSSPLAKSAVAGIDSPASATSSHSSGSARSRRSIHRGSAKPQSLRNSLLKQRAASHMSPGEARPASPASPATIRASQASARRRNSRSGAAELGLAMGASAGPSPGQSRAGSPGAQRSWSPARGGPARDLGESSPEADRRRHRLSLALGQEAQSTLAAAIPGSPAASLPAAARRASIASRRRRTSSQDSSADELKAVLG